MKTLKLALIAFTVLNIAACSDRSTLIIPKSGGVFTIVASAETETKSLKKAMRKAQKVCDRPNTYVNMTKVQTMHQGLDKEQQQLVDSAKDILPKNKTSGPFFPKSKSFKSTLTFTCER